MTGPGKDTIRMAIHDPERRGILIPTSQLEDLDLSVGDRFTLKKGQRELFAITIVKYASGEIFFDRNGIFIERTRRVDILMGGIFSDFRVDIKETDPLTLVIKTTDPGLAAIR